MLKKWRDLIQPTYNLEDKQDLTRKGPLHERLEEPDQDAKPSPKTGHLNTAAPTS